MLQPRNHPRVAAKRKLSEGFFPKERKAQAKSFYKLSLTDPQPELTLVRCEKRTGLSLEDVREAFEYGNWGNPPSFGGPKWAAIASEAINLGAAIREETWSEVDRITRVIDGLHHNNGRIVAKFAQLD